MILNLLLIIPLIGSLLIAIIPSYNSSSSNILYLKKNFQNSRNRTQMIALITSLFNFLISLILIIEYNNDTIFFQYISNFLYHNEISEYFLSYILLEFQGSSVYLGIDGLSIFFVLLTTAITPICILAS
jgi:NADH:ubiquinone oxidoreductase subunit 4 (subunit M)